MGAVNLTDVGTKVLVTASLGVLGWLGLQLRKYFDSRSKASDLAVQMQPLLLEVAKMLVVRWTIGTAPFESKPPTYEHTKALQAQLLEMLPRLDVLNRKSRRSLRDAIADASVALLMPSSSPYGPIAARAMLQAGSLLPVPTGPVFLRELSEFDRVHAPRLAEWIDAHCTTE